MPDSATSLLAQDRHLKERSAMVFAGGVWLFNLGLAAAVVVAVALGGLWFYRRSLQVTRNDWAAEVETLESELRPELLAQLIDLSRSIAVIQNLLQNHIFPSNTLTFLAETTLPQVQFNDFSLSGQARTIRLSGLAASYRTVADQVRTLESHREVERVEFGGLARSEKGLISFRLTITFKPTLLTLRSELQ